VRLHASLGQQMREIEVTSQNCASWATFREHLASQFQTMSATLSCKWVDEDGDAITIADDRDVCEMIRATGTDTIELIVWSDELFAAQLQAQLDMEYRNELSERDARMALLLQIDLPSRTTGHTMKIPFQETDS